MKIMKFPKTIQIDNQVWKVKISNNAIGASWVSCPGIIQIGAKNANADRVKEYFLHEVLEAIMTMHEHRFEKPNGEDIFVFTHQDFCYLVRSLCIALKDILKWT